MQVCEQLESEFGAQQCYNLLMHFAWTRLYAVGSCDVYPSSGQDTHIADRPARYQHQTFVLLRKMRVEALREGVQAALPYQSSTRT